ncbi:hypothetical protein N7U49_22900 [Streptomyces sp. AD2-2]|nr:hypothetical protein N7U49_22900 [Streptomyces sp. AD2-2]
MTSDIYTTVLAEVEREAAEATVSVVPRSRKRVIPQPEASDKAAPSDEEQDGPEAAEEAPDVPTEHAA